MAQKPEERRTNRCPSASRREIQSLKGAQGSPAKSRVTTNGRRYLMAESNRLKIVEITISVGGLMLALLVGIIGYLDYREGARLQSMPALHDAQLRLCEEVSTASAKLTAATGFDELDAGLDLISELKHGRALVLLEQPVLDRLVTLYNAALIFSIRDEIDDNFNNDLRCSIGDQALEVVHECRAMLARAFRRESNLGLDLVDANYSIEWSCPTESGNLPQRSTK